MYPFNFLRWWTRFHSEKYVSPRQKRAPNWSHTPKKVSQKVKDLFFVVSLVDFPPQKKTFEKLIAGGPFAPTKSQHGRGPNPFPQEKCGSVGRHRWGTRTCRQKKGFFWGMKNLTRWWFQTFFIFTPIWGRFPFWLIFFRWVETTN